MVSLHKIFLWNFYLVVLIQRYIQGLFGLILIGVAHAGSIPSSPLTTEQFNSNVQSSGTQDAYIGNSQLLTYGGIHVVNFTQGYLTICSVFSIDRGLLNCKKLTSKGRV